MSRERLGGPGYEQEHSRKGRGGLGMSRKCWGGLGMSRKTAGKAGEAWV